MSSAVTTPNSAKAKPHMLAIHAGESVVIVRKGDWTTLAVLGRKIIAAMRRRKRKAGNGRARFVHDLLVRHGAGARDFGLGRARCLYIVFALLESVP